MPATFGKRSVPDALLTTTKALPAAAASNSHDGIDLGGGRIPEGSRLICAVPATPSLVDAKKITLTVEDSADNSSFAAVASLGAQTITGADSEGGAETELSWILPSDVRQYVRVTQAVESGGGTNTAISTTVQVLR